MVEERAAREREERERERECVCVCVCRSEREGAPAREKKYERESNRETATHLPTFAEGPGLCVGYREAPITAVKSSGIELPAARSVAPCA